MKIINWLSVAVISSTLFISTAYADVSVSFGRGGTSVTYADPYPPPPPPPPPPVVEYRYVMPPPPIVEYRYLAPPPPPYHRWHRYGPPPPPPPMYHHHRHGPPPPGYGPRPGHRGPRW